MNLMNHRLMADVQTDIYVETDRQTVRLANKRQTKIARQRQRQGQANRYGSLKCLTDTRAIKSPVLYAHKHVNERHLYSAQSNKPSKTKLPHVILRAIEPIARPAPGYETAPRDHNTHRTIGRSHKKWDSTLQSSSVQCCICGGGDTPAILNVF